MSRGQKLDSLGKPDKMDFIEYKLTHDIFLLLIWKTCTDVMTYCSEKLLQTDTSTHHVLVYVQFVITVVIFLFHSMFHYLSFSYYLLFIKIKISYNI